jgi:hypothetical protein
MSLHLPDFRDQRPLSVRVRTNEKATINTDVLTRGEGRSV